MTPPPRVARTQNKEQEKPPPLPSSLPPSQPPPLPSSLPPSSPPPAPKSNPTPKAISRLAPNLKSASHSSLPNQIDPVNPNGASSSASTLPSISA
eukprot:CAMPEP_0201547692 /NCGR_PEP_ID=MMETSP0173_2-20130828/4189_1 /ASSEMBLY_ACC=CAM_ASM_000268 /TAXON_ID=218659 /ORGANISM="Vexillifera sp., Strain DIVA3 564/2" /LENGTH=94 /DNA_ID=CAMNT_0047956835 /DNA_START=122 /DNA_END=403 /DNA_ORIENTATION=-